MQDTSVQRYLEIPLRLMAEIGELRNFELNFVFKTYGVTVRIECGNADLLEKAKSIAKRSFLGRLTIVSDASEAVDYSFGLNYSKDQKYQLYENGRFRSEADTEFILLNFFTSYLRVTVAERAEPWVFVHAGVVGVKGRAIIIPGNSYTGKTTLVAELVKRGADYYSDEYAILDESGLVHPFPRDLSVRIDGDRSTVVQVSPSDLGCRIATGAAPVGLVLITEFESTATWIPEQLTLGNGIKELVPHTVSVRFNTEFSLKVLNKTLNRAIILKGPRNDAVDFAEIALSLMDNDSNWS